jgi:hypothetical protein
MPRWPREPAMEAGTRTRKLGDAAAARVDGGRSGQERPAMLKSCTALH